MSPVPAPPEVREQAVALYLAGESCTQVAARFGISHTAVSKWVIRAKGKGTRGVTHPLTIDDSPPVYEGGWINRGGVQYPANPLRERT